MSKVKSNVFNKYNVSFVILFVVCAAYSALVLPGIIDNSSSSIIVFETTAIEVIPVSQTKVAPRITPIPMQVTPPRVLNKIAPLYPKAARIKGVEGVVIVKALIDSKGSLVKTSIKSSSGSEILDAAAISSMKKWTFSPAIQGTGAIKSWVAVPFKFRLR